MRQLASIRIAVARVPASVWLAMALGLAIRLAYVAATYRHPLHNVDQLDYDAQARLTAAGHLFWGLGPNGQPQPSMWKAPGYGTFLGLLYAAFGSRMALVLSAQALLGPVTIALSWLLARRLFGARVAVAAAFLVAIYPLAWQFETPVWSEALATPLTVLVLLLVVEREPMPRRAAAVGALMGLSLLVRPSAVFLFAGIALTWLLAAGWRRGLGATALTVLAAALVIAPWTYRNHHQFGGFVPISVQDAAAFGTFNDDAAHDPVNPWAWRYNSARDRPLVEGLQNGTIRMTELELQHELRKRAVDYIKAHPESVPKAFFWNGLVRLWDVRRPARAMHDASFEGRTRWIAAIGLAMYYVLFPLALLALWRGRVRRRLVVPILGIALGASVVYTSDSGTRYRAPLEPLIVVLACAGAASLRSGGRLPGGRGS